MNKVAQLRFNDKTSKWEASYAGQVFLKSGSKQYVVDKIVNQISEKAKALGVTQVEEFGAPSELKPTVTQDPAVFFSINERFSILEDLVDMVAKGVIPSVIVSGTGGLGKTHTVLEGLHAAGLRNIETVLKEMGIVETAGTKTKSDGEDGEEDDVSFVIAPEIARKCYRIVKGFSTAKGLFRTLYENRFSTIVFDDCDVTKDPVAADMLKAALDSYDTRSVTWNSEAGFGNSDLPRTFEFEGGVIMITNKPIFKIPQALISRAMVADVSMTRPEVIERMTNIVESGKFMPEFEMEYKRDALAFIAKHAENPAVKEINLRTLINATKARAAKPEHWERISLYNLVA